MKTVIISGANNGLGYACAKELALNKDIYLVLACRDHLLRQVTGKYFSGLK